MERAQPPAPTLGTTRSPRWRQRRRHGRPQVPLVDDLAEFGEVPRVPRGRARIPPRDERLTRMASLSDRDFDGYGGALIRLASYFEAAAHEKCAFLDTDQA